VSGGGIELGFAGREALFEFVKERDRLLDLRLQAGGMGASAGKRERGRAQQRAPLRKRKRRGG
jgi:hypothetical protein